MTTREHCHTAGCWRVSWSRWGLISRVRVTTLRTDRVSHHPKWPQSRYIQFRSLRFVGWFQSVVADLLFFFNMCPGTSKRIWLTHILTAWISGDHILGFKLILSSQINPVLVYSNIFNLFHLRSSLEAFDILSMRSYPVLVVIWLDNHIFIGCTNKAVLLAESPNCVNESIIDGYAIL